MTVNAQHITMCIVHKGFRGFRDVSPASILGGKLIGLKSAIPYDTIHSTLPNIMTTDCANELSDNIKTNHDEPKRFIFT